MTREEAIDFLLKFRKDRNGELREVVNMAIEALQKPPISQRSMYQAGYKQGREEALKREPSEDGTLEVKVEDATKVGRVLISDDEHRGGLYYPDEYEPKGEDLISRAEAIEAITGALDAIDHVPKWVFDKLTCAINILPSADRPTDGDLISRAEAIEALGEEPPVWCDEEYEIAERDQWRADIEAIKSVPSADRPKGKWHYSDGKPATIGQSFGVICDQCGTESEYCTNFCGECGADMRGGEAT